jgi:protein phosphatase 1L
LQGGYVDCYQGFWRVQGSLAVSRGIGDRHLKQWITAEPETRVIRIEPDCEFLILASDGLWDKVNNQEAVDVVRPLCMGVEKPVPAFACKRLAELAVIRGSTDDISVMIIQLGHFDS